MTSPFASRLAKTFLFVLTVGGIFWLGTSVARLLFGYDIFLPGTLILKDQAEAARLQTIRLHALLGLWSDWAFLVATVGAVGTITLVGRSFKRYGWMLMCSVLFLLLIPVQAWMTWEDFKLFKLFDAYSGASLAPAAEIVGVFLQRQKDVTTSLCSGLALLSGFTIITLAVWRPLHRHES